MAGSAEEPNPRAEIVIGSRLVSEGGKPDAPPSPLKSPFGIDFDSKGTAILVELGGGRVHKLTPDGKLVKIAGDGSKSYRGDGEPAAKATFNGMHNVAITPKDEILIADSWNHCVRRIDPKTGIITTIAGTGKPGFSGDGGPAKQATFNFVMCITLNPKGDKLHVADLKNRRIREIDLKTGLVKTIAGNGKRGVPKDGASAVQSPLIDPRAVAADSKGDVYVLERGGHALRKVTPDGKIYTVAGTGKRGYRDGDALQAQFGSPKHICVDAEDNVYVADDQNAAIRKYDPRTKKVTTVLGRGVGTPKLSLKNPHGVCIEKGTLWVVDMGNDRLIRVKE